MARKWTAFLRTMESFLKQLKLKAYRRVLIVFLLGILFAVGIPPVSSQRTASPPIAQSWIDARNLEERGREHYLNKQFDKALEDWQRAAQAFAALGEELKQAIILGNLSLVHQQLGEWEEAEKAIAKSLNLLGFKHDSEIPKTWKIPDVSTDKLKILGPALEIYGRFWYGKEKPQRALYSWRLAAEIFEKKLNAPQGLIESQINQVQALQALGLYQQAIKLLGSALRVNYEGSLNLDEDRQKFIEKIEENLKQLPSHIQVKALLSLGEVLRAIGDLENSQKFLQDRLEVAKKLGSPKDITATQLSLGNTFLALGNLELERQAPIKYEYVPWRCESIKSLDKLPEKIKNIYKKADTNYRLAILNESLNSKNNHYRLRIKEKLSEEEQKKVLSQSPSSATGIKAQLNLMSLLVKTGEWRDAKQLASAIKLLDLPKSRTKVYAEINLAQNLACLLPSPAEDTSSWDKVLRRIEKAFQDARNSKEHLTSDSQDKFTRSSSPDNLDKLYEYLTGSLEQAIQDAKDLEEDKRANSYLFGNLGGLYEYLAVSEPNCLAQQKQQETLTLNCRQKTQKLRQKAQKLTQKALYLAQPSEASDIAYQWQWQLGRLLKAQTEQAQAENRAAEAQEILERAIATYGEAYRTVKSLRDDLLYTEPERQFSFRDRVEPLYREYVSLLLSLNQEDDDQFQFIVLPEAAEKIPKAREVIDSLQLAELENLLGCKLVERAGFVAVDRVVATQEKTAAIYPIILEERIEVILKLPSQKQLEHYRVRVSHDKVENTLKQLRYSLEQPYFSSRKGKTAAQEVYNWLIKPAEEKGLLEPDQIKTLVFVLDGPFRNIPMAALYDDDCEKYLVEKYAIAVALGNLELPDSQPKKQFKALIAGMSKKPKFQPAQGEQFGPLKYVEKEVDGIKSILKDAKELRNEEFNRQELLAEIKAAPYNVVHLATHGEFGFSRDSTFILTAATESDEDFEQIKADLNELDNLLQVREPAPIELLVLSACETATGDNREVLGIAGMAVQSGARSTLASLWSIDDWSTVELMRQFYQELTKNEVTKAEALRRAQLHLLQNPAAYQPSHWAPYVLVGDWR